MLRCKQNGAVTPTAPEGVKQWGDRLLRNSTHTVTASSRSFELQSTGHLLELGGAVACTARRQPSRPRSKHAATSRELLDLPESLSKSSQPRVLFGNSDAFARRWRGRKPSRSRRDWRVELTQGCKERRRFPLRAQVATYHDRCRPEVAVAIHRRPLSSSHWVARSSSGRQVARRLPGRHSSVAASPLRCRSGLCVRRSSSGRRYLGALKVVFCPKAHAGHW